MIKTDKNPYFQGAYVLVDKEHRKQKNQTANYLVCYKMPSAIGKNRSGWGMRVGSGGCKLRLWWWELSRLSTGKDDHVDIW